MFSVVHAAQVLPGPLTIQVVSAVDAKPIEDVTIHVGGRMAVSDQTGKVVFDGIPAGTYNLWTRQPGHQEFRETIELKNGERTPQVVRLVPEVLSPLKFQFVEEISGEPVGCARIHMVPKAVSAALQGPMVFSTDSGGNVATIPVPEGVYQLTVEAPGYAVLVQDIEHKATEKPVEFKLKAIVKPISCAIAVTGEGGKPLPNADVELWEVYPLARITSGRTDAGGVVTFSDLRIGTINPVAKDKSLPVTHRAEAVVRVQAEGYVAALQSVRLIDGGRLPVTLDPQKVVAEQQPNESKGDAQRLMPGQSASFKIDKPTDQDWFAFELREPARVHLTFNNCPIELLTTLFDAAGKTVASFGKYSGAPAAGVWDLAAGRYWIQVTEWGMNGASEAEIIMSLTTEPAADPLESNNTAVEAKPIQIGQHMRGLIFPVGDADHFTLHLDRPGCLRVESANAPGIERTVSIVDKNEKECGVLSFYAGAGGAREWQFEPGDYQVVVTEWGNNGCSLDPYDFRVLFATDDGVDDPINRPGARISAVRHLPLYSRTYASINPIGDRDIYAVSIPSKGTLHVFQQGSTELTTQLLDGRGNVLRSTSSYANSSCHATHPFTGAATVYLEVTEWGNNGWSPFPYELRTWFDPAGELERLQDNDSQKTATPIELGTMVRDNILPTGDQDWYQLVVDQPGVLNVWIDARPEMTVTLINAAGKSLGTMNTYSTSQNQINWEVVPGVYYLQVTSWGNNDEAPWDYALKATLNRAVPGETAELAKSPAVTLKMGEARPCGIEQIGDVERYRVSIPAKGEYACFVGGPLETTTTATDIRTGTVLFTRNAYAGGTARHEFVTEGPVELELTVTEWGNNGANIQPNWIMVGPREASLLAPAVNWTVDPLEPTKVTFTLAPVPGVASLPAVSLDINADGNPDGTLGQGQSLTLEFPAQGLYRVTSWGAQGPVSARGEFWVQATGQPVREGVRVLIATPGEGELIDQMVPVRVTALSYEGKAIRQVDLQVNGRSVGADYTLPYEFEVPWQMLAGGACTLAAVATDASGKRETATRKVVISDYFNLLPAEGAVVTGNDVTISWDGGQFGAAKVRYRLKGDGKTDMPWTEVVGQNARARRVRIADLEAGKVYEFQPLGGTEPGPVREVTRVKGLAFTQSRYGGTIQRDYDQKIPVAVRNHAAEKRIVRLRCDLPQNSNLLVAFIGDGEKNRPVELAPGEQRAFTLGFSAQDVIKERHVLPIYIESEDGYSDQAEVEVLVKLPKVDLEWTNVTPTGQGGLGRTYELLNKGDTLTDVSVVAAKDAVRISPEVKHGLIQAGQRMRFEVYPRIQEGFTGCEDEIQATSIGKTASIRYEGKLKPGEQIFRLDMTAGLDPVTGEPADIDAARRAARRLVGQYLSPAAVDWTKRTDPEDTDRDGKPDRWTVIDELNRTQWFGRDTDGDGEVDFAQADVGLDGEIDHSSVLQNGRWQATNLLDAWLEMNFAIPQHRSQYEKHDLDLVVNGKIVGQLKQTIPEGNYRFPLAPTALSWGGGDNQLEINSHFLNYAHYAISSDFQLKTRLLATDAYMAGTSREDAVKRLFESDKDFTTDGPDYSISSEDLDVSPRDNLKPGSLVRISGTVRNLGAGSSGRLEVALFLAIPGTDGKELMRQTIASPGMMTDAPFEFVWPAAPGNHSLRVVADPDNLVGESNRKNNAAIVGVVVPGDDAPPVLAVSKPENNLTADNGAVSLLATATDESGIIGMDLYVDGGMSKPLYRTSNGFEGTAHLQPGTHSLRFRVTDSGGLQVEETRTVKVEATQPQCKIISPSGGAAIDTSEARVLISASKVAQACVRVNRGPWLGLQPTGDMWGGRVELPFGQCEIEALVIDSAGVRQTQAATVNCTAQPEEEKKDEQAKQEEKKPGAGEVTGQGRDAQGDAQGETLQEGPGVKLGKEQPSQTGRQPQTPGSGKTPAVTGPDKPAQPASGGPAKPVTGQNQNAGQTDGPSAGGGVKREPNAQNEADRSNAGVAKADEPPAVDADRARPADIPEENSVTPPPGVVAPAPRPYTPPAAVPAAPGGQRRAPAGFAVNRQRNDWYCPNRPKIGINFKLPEWLTKDEFDKILKKGPNSPEFKALEAKLLAGYWYRSFGRSANGESMDKLLLKYKDLLLKRCGRLDQADGKLPSFLQSLGFAASDPPTDPRELEAWRNKMKELTEIYWLRLLATEDPSTVVDGMRQRMDALSKYDEASQMQAEAIIQTIQANQKITQDVLEALPYTGEALDIMAAVTGESLSGEEISGWERFFRAACVAGPVALEETLKRSPRAQEAIGEFLAATGEMTSEMKNNLLRRIGVDVEKFDQFADDAAKFLTKERNVFSKNADDVVDAAKNGYRQTAEGIEDLRQMEKAKDASRQTVNELDDLVKKGGKAGDDEMEKAILNVQRDKTAQSVMNSAEVSDDVRKKANDTIKKIYGDADVPTMDRIKNSEEVRKYAREHGLDPESIDASVWSPTNKKGPRPGEPGYVDPDFSKYGRDRDVTYQITGKTKDGRTVTLDVNHDISGPIYQEELYKRCHGGQLPANPAEVGKFADDMDQMVTSKWHREAYNTGPDVHINDWLNNDITPPVARPQDIRDTMITKSDHWFHQASEAGSDAAKYSRDMSEGMRQATKQWDNIVSKRIALYGANVPPQLEKAIDIFKQVDKGAVSAKQAEHMLEQLGNLSGGGKLTPGKVVENMAYYFEAMEKGPGKTFRGIKTAELAKTLDSVGDMSKRTDLINEAYRGGQISGETFRQMREGSFKLPPNPTPQQTQQLKDWVIGAWGRRAISLTEKNLIEGQTGPLDQ
jgi:hypothetical protein